MPSFRASGAMSVPLFAALVAYFVSTPLVAGAQSSRAVTVKPDELEPVTVAQLLIDIPELGDLTYVKDGYRVAFLKRLRELGYPAVGAEDLTFQKDHSDRARFVIGGTLNAFDCKGRAMRNCMLAVEWKVLDRRADEVVYKVQTRFYALDMPADSAERAKRLLDGAFERLLLRPAFVSVLKKAQAAEPQVAYPQAHVTRCPRASLAMPGEAQQALDAVVVLRAAQSHGSGVVISPDGLALTAAHVVDGQEVTARYRDGSERKVTTLRIHRDQDVALIRIDNAPATCVPEAAAEPGMGADIYAIGSPASTELSFTLTRGIVSGSREFQGQRFLQTDASVNPGNSGGPLLDAEGRLSAIVSWKLAGVGIEGVSFGVPTAAALRSLGLVLSEQGEPIAPAVAKPVVAKLWVDEADPKQSLDPDRDRAVALSKATPVYVKLMRTGGLLTAVGGGVIVLQSWLRYKLTDLDYEGFQTQRSWNTAGWVFFGVGAGAYAAHFFLRPKSPPDVPPAGKRVSIAPSVSGLRVRF